MEELNDRHEYFNPYLSQCGECKFLNWSSYTCEAFPNGIPDSLLSGKQKHDKPIQGQKGNTVFTSES